MYNLYAIFTVFIIVLGNYTCRCRRTTYENNKISKKPESQINILSYNVQRLPIFFRRDIDINSLIEKYEIICLQEHMSNIRYSIQSYGYNIIHPAAKSYKVVTDSGLTIYSIYQIEFLDFVEYDKSESIDRFADKGFLVVKILDIIVINTHLQAYGSHIKYDQFKQLFDYINSKFDKTIKIIIIGDFNLDLRTMIVEHFDKISPLESTHFDKEPQFIDGAFYRNLNILYTGLEKMDKLTDHFGVCMQLKL